MRRRSAARTGPHPGVIMALASAALFGASTPLAKVLVGVVDPWLLAGILYLGSGIGLWIVRAVRRATVRAEHALGRTDWPWMAGAILFGGIIGPVLLLFGLTATPASSASLLLNLEGVLTALLAWFVFRENFDRRVVLGMISIVLGAAVLSWPDTVTFAGAIGPLAIAGACLAWALDNNLTRKVSLSDPVQIAMVKGLAAGAVNLALASAGGAALPDAPTALAAGVVGLFGYGVSVVLFVHGLRHLGTARTGAYFATAPFIGAVIAVLGLGEPVSLGMIAAGTLMAVGVWLHMTERHEHMHDHAPLAHSHRHVHDEHHRHEHGPGDPPGEPHTHRHVHAALRHRHAHFPDEHHRHGH